MSRTFVATFTVVVEDDEASLEDVKDYLNEALIVDLDTEEAGNPVQAASATVHVDGLIEERAVDAEYSSEWDTGETITTKCKYYPHSKVCTDIQDSGEAPEGTLVDEWVTVNCTHVPLLPSGGVVELRAKNGVTFDY